MDSERKKEVIQWKSMILQFKKTEIEQIMKVLTRISPINGKVKRKLPSHAWLLNLHMNITNI